MAVPPANKFELGCIINCLHSASSEHSLLTSLKVNGLAKVSRAKSHKLGSELESLSKDLELVKELSLQACVDLTGATAKYWCWKHLHIEPRTVPMDTCCDEAWLRKIANVMYRLKAAISSNNAQTGAASNHATADATM